MDEASPLKTFTNLPVVKQEKFIGSAIREFGEKGYHRASINAIVKELGIAKGSVYQYFEDKKALYFFVFFHSMEMVKHNLKTVRSETAGLSLSARLEKTLEAGVRFIDEHPYVYRLYVTFLHDESMPMRHELLSELRRHSIGYIVSLLESARERGELKPGIDPDTAAFIIDAVMDRFLLARTQKSEGYVSGLYTADASSISQYIRRIVHILSGGVSHG